MPTDDRIESLWTDLPAVNLPETSANPELAALEQYHARFEAVAMHMAGHKFGTPEYNTAEQVMLCLVDGFLEAFPPDEEPGDLGDLTTYDPAEDKWGKQAVCTDCGAWPHLSACKWKGRPPEKVGWVWACAECGHVGSQVHHIEHRPGCSQESP